MRVPGPCLGPSGGRVSHGAGQGLCSRCLVFTGCFGGGEDPCEVCAVACMCVLKCTEVFLHRIHCPNPPAH